MKVVLPFYGGDARLLDKNLMWYKELDGKLDADCYLAADETVVIAPYVTLAQTVFRSVKTIQFPRHKHSHWPFQQNNSFTHVAWEMSKQKEPWLWMETDAVPLKRGWLQILFEEYRKGKKPFGGHWNPAANIFNGVAIYPPNISAYSVKMMTAGITEGRSADGKVAQSPWDAAGSKQVQPHLHVMNHVMQHVWDVNGVCPTFPNGDAVAQLVRPEVCVFHRCKDGSLIDRLRDPGRIGSKARCAVGLDTVHCIVEPPKPTPVKQPKTASLFIVSFRGDFDWLPYLFKSIDRHLAGFEEVVLTMPEGDFDFLCEKYPELIEYTWLRPVEVSEQGFKSSFMAHLWTKVNADKFCAGDVIVHVDSDCILIAKTTPQTFLKNGKCLNLCTAYSLLEKTVPWQAATEKALGQKVEFETMRRHGCTYPRECYPAFRDHFEKINRRPLREYLEAESGRGGTEPFSEFNSLGAFGMYFMPERFLFLNTSTDEQPVNTIHQFWSMKRAAHPEAQKVFAEHDLL